MILTQLVWSSNLAHQVIKHSPVKTIAVMSILFPCVRNQTELNCTSQWKCGFVSNQILFCNSKCVFSCVRQFSFSILQEFIYFLPNTHNGKKKNSDETEKLISCFHLDHQLFRQMITVHLLTHKQQPKMMFYLTNGWGQVIYKCCHFVRWLMTVVVSLTL